MSLIHSFLSISCLQALPGQHYLSGFCNAFPTGVLTWPTFNHDSKLFRINAKLCITRCPGHDLVLASLSSLLCAALPLLSTSQPPCSSLTCQAISHFSSFLHLEPTSPIHILAVFYPLGAQLKYHSLREDFPTHSNLKKSSCYYFLSQILASAQFIIISPAFQFLCLPPQLQCEHLNISCPVAGVCPVVSTMNDCGELSLFLLFSYLASPPSSSKSRTPPFCGELLPYGLRELTLPHPQSDQNGHSDWFRDEHVTLTESISAPPHCPWDLLDGCFQRWFWDYELPMNVVRLVLTTVPCWGNLRMKPSRG